MTVGVGVFSYFCKLFSMDTNILNLKIVYNLFFFFPCLLVSILSTVVISSAIGISLEKPECLFLQHHKACNGFEFILPILIIVANCYCRRGENIGTIISI